MRLLFTADTNSHCSKGLKIWINSLSLHKAQVKRLAQGHTAKKWSHADPKIQTLLFLLMCDLGKPFHLSEPDSRRWVAISMEQAWWI